MTADSTLEQSLYRLAEIAWSPRRIDPTSEFVLRADQVTELSTGNMAAVVERLYAHARTWAPGFEIPYRIPQTKIAQMTEAAGQYRVDEDGYVFIDVAPEFMGNRSAVLAILAHEACHHILDLSGLHRDRREDVERLTDMAAFICGFGELILAGHSQIRNNGSTWTRLHLGYLSSAEYRSALRLGSACATHSEHRSESTRWFPLVASVALDSPSGPGRSRQHGAFLAVIRVANQTRKVALTLLGGNRELLNRLVEYERKRDPKAPEVELLDAVIASLKRDRR